MVRSSSSTIHLSFVSGMQNMSAMSPSPSRCSSPSLPITTSQQYQIDGCMQRRDFLSCSTTSFALKRSHLRHPSSGSNLYLSLPCTTEQSPQTQSRCSTKSKCKCSKCSTPLTKMCLLVLPREVGRPSVLNSHWSSYEIRRMTQERFAWSRIRRWSIRISMLWSGIVQWYTGIRRVEQGDVIVCTPSQVSVHNDFLTRLITNC